MKKRKWKWWQILLLVVIWPIGILVLFYKAVMWAVERINVDNQRSKSLYQIPVQNPQRDSSKEKNSKIALGVYIFLFVSSTVLNYYPVAIFFGFLTLGQMINMGIVKTPPKRDTESPINGESLDDQEFLRDKIQDSSITVESLKTDARIETAENKLQTLHQQIRIAQTTLADIQRSQDDTLAKQEQSVNTALERERKRLAKMKELYQAVQYAIDLYPTVFANFPALVLSEEEKVLYDSLVPTVALHLNCMSMKDLRSAYRANQKAIDEFAKRFEGQYTTKANQALYKLMVIGLRAELQNALYIIKYDKLEKAIDQIKGITAKYTSLADNGSQTIHNSLKKFIIGVESLFINAVKIEYEYLVQKEANRQEQLAIREQMRQEAEEIRRLRDEQIKIEKEEQKFAEQIAQVQNQLLSAEDPSVQETLKMRIAELETQLSVVYENKEKILSLQNGKAGCVYVISNLGSFGDNVFKIGMTRRLNPDDRITELSGASVPFGFDVHCFVFSDDAVSLERQIHTALNSRRVNRINQRKEFFQVSIDELEELILSIQPSAEFKRTAVAEQYRLSQSMDESRSFYFSMSLDDEEEPEGEAEEEEVPLS